MILREITSNDLSRYCFKENEHDEPTMFTVIVTKDPCSIFFDLAYESLGLPMNRKETIYSSIDRYHKAEEFANKGKTIRTIDYIGLKCLIYTSKKFSNPKKLLEFVYKHLSIDENDLIREKNDIIKYFTRLTEQIL